MAVEFKELKTVIEKVAFLIKQDPELAYNNDKLVFTYLYREIGSEKVNDITGYDLFLCFVSKYEPLTKIETISRARRKFVAKLKKEGSFIEKSQEPQKTLFKIKNSD
jgi:hypothetical protein